MASPTKKEIRKQITEILATAKQQATTNLYDASETLEQVDRIFYPVVEEVNGNHARRRAEPSSQKITYLSKYANILFEWLQEYSEAEQYFRELSKILPRETRVWKGIGDCYRKRDLHEEAIKQYEIALKKSEQDDGASPIEEASVQKRKALSHIELKQYDEAEASLEKALKKNKENIIYLCNLGKVKELQGKSEDAIEFYRKAYDLTQKGKFRRKIANEEYIEEALSKIVEIDDIAKRIKADLEKSCQDAQFRKVLNAFQKLMNKNNQLRNEALDLEKKYDRIQAELLDHVTANAIYLPQQLTAEVNVEFIFKFEDLKKQFLGLHERVANFQKIVSLKEELRFKLDDWEIKIAQHITNLSDEEHNQILEYFAGFYKTFSCIYITSQVIVSGQSILGSETTEGSLLSTVASFSPFLGDARSNSINSIEDFLLNQEIKENAEKMAVLVEDLSELDHRIGEACYNIVIDPKKQDKILKATDKDLENATKNLFKKIKKVAGQIADKIENKTYGELYERPAAKLGNLDANFLIEKWLNNEIYKKTNSESLTRVVLAQMNGNNFPPEMKKGSEGKVKGPCCQIF